MGANKVRPVIFLVTDKQFRDIQEAVEQFDLSRSEILRRALRVGLPILAQVGFPGIPHRQHGLGQVEP